MTQENTDTNTPVPNPFAGTWEEFFRDNHPEGLILQYMYVNGVYASIKTKRVTLNEIFHHYGNVHHKRLGQCNSGILYMHEWLNYLNNVSNINKLMSPANLNQLSIILYTKYHYLYLSDLKLILEGILESKYGKFYGSVDAQLIMSAFKEYSAERKKIEEGIKSKKYY